MKYIAAQNEINSYVKKGYEISYLVIDKDGYPIEGFASKKRAIALAKQMGGKVRKHIERLDRKYYEDKIVFMG